MLFSSRNSAPRATRRGVGAAVAIAATLGASLAATAGIAAADTHASPLSADPVTKVKLGTGVTPAPTTLPPGPLTGLVEGSNVHIHTDAGTGSQIFRVAARLCRAGLDIQDTAGFAPSQSGDCIAAPFVAGSDDSIVNGDSAPPNTSVDLDFRMGKGTQSFSWDAGASTSTITCDQNNPCALWLDHFVPAGATADGSGHVYKHYDVTYAGPPGAPSATATAGNGTGTVNWSAPASIGNAAISSYVVTLTGGSSTPASPVTVSGTTTSQAFTGLTNFATYTATVQAKNTAADGTTTFTGPASAPVTFTPGPAGPANVQGSAGDTKVDLTWTAPPGATPTDYEVTASPAPVPGPATRLTGSTAPSYTFTGLTNGTAYTFTVRAVYGSNFSASSAPSAPVAPAGRFLQQTITVTRPQGALILTQVCGAKGATHTGTAPTLPGGTADPNFDATAGEYPYPPNFTPNYPTNCDVNLGTASLIASGPGANQFFDAKGDISQVTVTDFRDSDPGWNVTGSMSAFTSGTNSFSGNQLGWTPSSTDAAPFTDGSGGPAYDQTVTPGPAVAPNTVAPGGLATSKPLASAAAGAGQGRARLDATLDLWIPVTAKAGTYTGVLTITAV